MLLTNWGTTNKSSQNYLKTSFNSDVNKVDFAIFSAMKEEVEFFTEFFSNSQCQKIRLANFDFDILEYKNKKILFAQTGLGTTFAASVVTFVHDHFHPDYMFLTGTAGGINQELKVNDVVIVEKVFEAEMHATLDLLRNTPFETCLTHPLKKTVFPTIYSANEKLLGLVDNFDTLNVQTYKGTVVSSNSFPAPIKLYENIKTNFCFSIDMETSAFYQIAWLLNIPVLAIRGISNLLNPDGSDDEVHKSDVKGSSLAAAQVTWEIIKKLIVELEKNEITSESDDNSQVARLINYFNLTPHPEGGYYARSYQSSATVKSLDENRYNNETRFAGTAIYYLLHRLEFSAWHSLKSDEIWHFCKGSPVKIHTLDQKGEYKFYLLGDPFIHDDAHFHVPIQADTWFAAELIDKTSYSLMSCTVSPGFEFKDFKLGKRALLTELFPEHYELIKKFTLA